MYFDLTTETGVKSFLTRVQFLIDKQKKVDLTEKREKRTLSQNNYLHLILSWFCIETGNQLEFVKQEYFKRLCNPDIFLFDRDDDYLGKVTIIRSSKDIDTKQMTDAIDKFRNWSVREAGIYLPEANEDKFLEDIQEEMSRQRQWL
ncbi:hypothetical protein JGH11_10970 [Dysgonomonas sp. Marseille-P4677]|uniref:hypothetical protein n=1 Tax=Dysgonomonas sp. Marseille-P4677 TaxID=2364790 RepID=UPI001912377F|nr:hypothetical protein [Dysgonomonas sp. Marseille-P4677]MBK5721395.1 hypothetical protein [Dysgonomonas sp. Marseille-P4677]